MKNKANMFSDWSEVTNGARNQIVFENLNKSYGAFEIRNNYDRTLCKALSLMVLTALFILGLSFFSPTKKAILIIPDTSAIQTEPPVFELPKALPPSPHVPLNPHSVQKNPNTFSRPVVTNDSIMPQDTSQSLALNTSNPSENLSDSNGTDIESTSGESTPTANNTEISPDSVFSFSDVRPEFPGGDKKLMRFLTSNTRIPESLIGSGKGINEKFEVEFIVDNDGSITSASLLKGDSQYNELNKEALRVINKMPQWKPGKQNGKEVKVRMILPFRFEVKN